jgi:hypothetical protein
MLLLHLGIEDRYKQVSYFKHVKHELETMLVGLTNQCNLLSGLGSVLNALSLPQTAFFMELV